MSPRERKIEEALIDWFKREGFELQQGYVLSDEGDLLINIEALSRYIADEIER